MGGKNIQTPNLDRMAAEGIRFNNLFAGSSVCAPTRCCFLTGKHSGHTSVRANGGGTPLRAEEETIASMLKPLGYATGGFGKWGCGGRDSTGVPEKHGFDVFLGYYDQVHAHTYYPPYLIRNSEEVPLEGNNGGSDGKTYSHYVIHDAAMKFIREHGQAAVLRLPALHAAARQLRHPRQRSRLGDLQGQAVARAGAPLRRDGHDGGPAGRRGPRAAQGTGHRREHARLLQRRQRRRRLLQLRRASARRARRQQESADRRRVSRQARATSTKAACAFRSSPAGRARSRRAASAITSATSPTCCPPSPKSPAPRRRRTSTASPSCPS